MYTSTGKERRTLRGQAHHLEATIQIGQAGLHGPLIEKTRAELALHELVKVRVRRTCLDDAKEIAQDLAKATEAELVEVKGHTIVLYRPASADEGDSDGTSG